MLKSSSLLLLLLLFFAACGTSPQADVVHQYAVNLDANYKDVIVQLSALNAAVDSFVASPSADGFTRAQQAWIDARPAYAECEVSRFYGGPIDQAQGSINEWPIDENFIDYTAGNASGGIINRPQDYPQITPEALVMADQQGGTENLALGFHAIEFLLWGQRPDQTQGPGQRPYTDYVDGGTASNQDRRRAYLKIATALLLADMQALEAQWDLQNPQSYASQLVSSPDKDGLTKIMRGLSNMAISELLYERLDDPFITKDRKDEESCFSESTAGDLVANALGVENVYLGRYNDQQGAGITSLVQAKDPALDATMKQQLQAIRAAIEAIPPPFDHAVLAPSGSEPNLKVQAAIDAFLPLQDTLQAVANTLGLVINL